MLGMNENRGDYKREKASNLLLTLTPSKIC